MIRYHTLLKLVFIFHIGYLHADNNTDAIYDQIAQIFNERSNIIKQLDQNVQKRQKLSQEEEKINIIINEEKKRSHDYQEELKDKVNQAVFWHYNQKKLIWQQLLMQESSIDAPSICQHLVQSAKKNVESILSKTRTLESKLAELELEKKQYNTLFEEHTLILSKLDEEESLLKSLLLEIQQRELENKEQELDSIEILTETFDFNSLQQPLINISTRRHKDFQGATIINAKAGEPIKAISDGVVIFADHLKGLGHMIIVEHSDKYISLYANCQSLAQDVGNRVGRGQTLAFVGSSGQIGKEALYFELRHAGDIIPTPGAWLT